MCREILIKQCGLWQPTKCIRMFMQVVGRLLIPATWFSWLLNSICLSHWSDCHSIAINTFDQPRFGKLSRSTIRRSVGGCVRMSKPDQNEISRVRGIEFYARCVLPAAERERERHDVISLD